MSHASDAGQLKDDYTFNFIWADDALEYSDFIVVSDCRSSHSWPRLNATAELIIRAVASITAAAATTAAVTATISAAGVATTAAADGAATATSATTAILALVGVDE